MYKFFVFLVILLTGFVFWFLVTSPMCGAFVCGV
jgi:hypothetical protein